MKGRLFALFLLGFALIKTLLLRLLPRRSPLRGFDERYGVEGILAVTAEEHAILIGASRCIACGRCNDDRAPSGAPERRVMDLVLQGVRSLPGFRRTAVEFEGLRLEAARQAESRCPVGVPIVALHELVRGHARRQNELGLAPSRA